MPVSKNAWIRYRALDACFRNTRKRYYFEDLMDVVNDVLYDFDGSDVGDRQLRQDIVDMQSEALGAAPIVTRRDGHRVYYTYEDKDFSILKLPRCHPAGILLSASLSAPSSTRTVASP